LRLGVGLYFYDDYLNLNFIIMKNRFYTLQERQDYRDHIRKYEVMAFVKGFSIGAALMIVLWMI
jgi:hypothetical protein